VHAVRGLDFEVAPARCVGLLGPNGAGKTTVMRMIMGLTRPSAGELFVFGMPVAQLTRQDLQQFQQQFVAPNNMVLCVFGDVKADAVRRAVESTFGGMPSRPLQFPAAPAERLAENRDKTEYRPREQAVLLLGYSGVDIRSPDRYAFEVLDAAYSGQGSRIFLRIRDELGLAYYVGASQLLGLDPGYFAFYVGTTPQKLDTCRDELFAELKKLQVEGLSAEELARAKNSLIGQQKVQRQDNGQLALAAGLDELYGLGYDFFQKLEAHYQAVTGDDIRRVATTYFGDRPRALVVVRPPEQ
jgi:zinc protease